VQWGGEEEKVDRPVSQEGVSFTSPSNTNGDDIITDSNIDVSVMSVNILRSCLTRKNTPAHVHKHTRKHINVF
jgi:hypothetical protein